jgi:ferredoxin--NADP+ reductase
MVFEILEKRELARRIKLMTIYAPIIAKKAKAGQFVIIIVDDFGERFPLTLVAWDKLKGTITLVFQEVGVSTRKLGLLSVGERIQHVVGPLGNPREEHRYGNVVVVGGGVGIAAALPKAFALKAVGNRVTSIIGAQSADLIILEKEISDASDELIITTDNGSKGLKGFTSDALRTMLSNGRIVDYVFAVGPIPMMKAIADITRPLKIRTVVSLNPIMVDGTGMCGGCRVTVGGRTLFACVDGPEFDAHLVDFMELNSRLRTYLNEEHIALERLENVWRHRVDHYAQASG